MTHDQRVTELLAANNREVERRRNAERALQLVCSWAGINTQRPGTVVAKGIAALLAGRPDDPAVARARELVSMKEHERETRQTRKLD